MNKRLLRRVHDVKYRELEKLVGQRITISSFTAIGEGVAAAIQPYASSCGKLLLRSTDLHLILAKYKMLDLRFMTTNSILSRNDRVSLKILEDLGFVSSKTEIKTMDDVIADVEGRDSSFIGDLVEQAQAGHEWLKVFLDIWPLRDALAEYMAAIRSARESGASDEDASTVGFEQLILQVPGLFPVQFQIRDACITNSDFVWTHKHFYM